MKAMLIWSDGHSLNYTIFEDKDNKTGFERAQEQMFNEYDERDNDFEADPECGACKAANFCSYEADGTDSCIWQIVEFLDDNPLQAAITSYSDACETLGVMVDVVEDFLEEKGIKQTWLAEKIGKSFSQTNAYVCNRRQPSLEQLFEIAKILGVDVKELIDDKEKK